MNRRILKFTQARIRALEPEDKEYQIYDDSGDSPRGFAVRVYPSGVKVFTLYRKFRGRNRRVSLGKFPDLRLELALVKAREATDAMQLDIDPAAVARARVGREITVKGVLDSYIEDSRDRLKPGSVREYKSIAKHHLASLYSTRLADVTRDVVLKLHRKITQAGKATTANKTVRLLNVLFNYARHEYLDEHGKSLFADNPVGIVRAKRKMNRDQRRKTRIKQSELAEWWKGTDELILPVFRDFLRTLVLTGLRCQEGAQITGAQLDTDERTLYWEDTKTGEFTLPLGDWLFEMLSKRKKQYDDGPLFESPNPSRRGVAIHDAQKALKKITPVVTHHDCRRTFISIAESLDIPYHLLQSLLNHAPGGMTETYIVREVERMRLPMQRIEDEILRLIKD